MSEAENDERRWILFEQMAHDVAEMKKDRESRWILVEEMARDMKATNDLVSEIPKISDRLGRVEADVTEIKGELVVHRQILKEHSAILKEHSAILKEHSAILGQHSEDLTEIKHEVTGLKAASHTHA